MHFSNRNADEWVKPPGKTKENFEAVLKTLHRPVATFGGGLRMNRDGALWGQPVSAWSAATDNFVARDN